MFSTSTSRLLQRPFLLRLLQTTGLSLALMTASAAVVRAADANDTDTEIGADGTPGIGDPFGNVPAGPGQPAAAVATASSATGNATATASATGGNGGGSIGEQNDTPGGDASASSTASTTSSGDALSSANATGGNYGVGGFGTRAPGGSATATADASAAGRGAAIATAIATTGESGDDPLPVPVANATASAETAQGGFAQALSTLNFLGESEGTATSTAKTSFGGVSAQSTTYTSSTYIFGSGTAEAIARGGSGQTSLTPDVVAGAISTALPDKAYATMLIDGASNVADALLGPRDEIFGAAIFYGFPVSSTFDFHYQGDLLFGVISGFAFDISVNGESVFSGDSVSDTVIDLGSNFGPNIDLTISEFSGLGSFAIAGVVPEPSTWAMLLLGFAGLGLTGYRQTRAAKPQGA